MAGERSERVPAQTLDQRLRALRQANEIRSRRAALKKELASGRVRIEDVLARPPDCAKTAKVRDLLRSRGLSCAAAHERTSAKPGAGKRAAIALFEDISRSA